MLQRPLRKLQQVPLKLQCGSTVLLQGCKNIGGEMEKIGFVGLGIMGKPMSKNLIKAGHKLVIYDIVPKPVEELKQAGAEVGTSPSDGGRGRRARWRKHCGR